MRRLLLCGLMAAALVAPGLTTIGNHAAAATHCGSWMNAKQSPNRRADELVAAMNRTQKLAMVHQQLSDFTHFGAAGSIPAIKSLCVPALLLNDAGSGLGDGQTNVTAYPAAISQASAWSGAMAHRLGSSLGRESFDKGINVLLAPDVNIARTPLNGRTSEALGEDPYLSGRIGAAYIRGVQSRHVIATVKHYDANNQETNRGTIDEKISERTLAEIYQPAFAAAVRQGHAGSAMCAYNKVNGVYSCQNRTVLRTDLDKRIGFKGFVMSDWGATHSTVASARNGLDMEMSVIQEQGSGSSQGSGGTEYYENYYGKPLAKAVAKGTVSIHLLNEMVHRIVRSMFAIGLFDHPAPTEPAAYATDVDTTANRAVARKAAEAGSVLLKNRRKALPISGTGKTIAVIGIDASAGAQVVDQAGGSVRAIEPNVVTPLQGLTTRAAKAGDTVVYDDGTNTAEAAAVAKTADVAIVDIGYTESEGVDQTNLGYNNGACDLKCVTKPSNADALTKAVAAANKRTVVVLNTGGPAEMPWLSKVAAVLEAWYPGEEDGNAVAALLFGDVNPAGKLPITFPRSLSQLPTRTAKQWPGVHGVATYSEGLLVGYRWYDAKHLRPLFPFGFGLSYTNFHMSRLHVHATHGTVRVSYRLANTGHRIGSDVVQVYVGDPRSSGEPPHQLKNFRRTTLAPGHSTRVTVTLGSHAFAHWATHHHAWRVSSGCYSIHVGDSSRHLPLLAHIARAGGHCTR